MLLGETSAFAVLLTLLVVGFVGFFVVVVGSMIRAVTCAFRTLGRALFGAGHPDPGVPVNTLVGCPNTRCGYLNPPQARYCARCGSRLRG